MLVLGITHPVCWNTGAAILRHGELLAMVEEERFNEARRLLHDAGLDAELRPE